jgi:hypothetical protein
MRIAYVSLHWPRTRNSGVGKKIQSQIAAWKTMGHDTQLFMHTSLHEPQSELIEANYFFYEKTGKIRTEVNRIYAMSRMLAAIRDFHPDLIYLRYGIYVYPGHRLMDIAPVIEEINTNDLTQHEELGHIYSLYNRFTRGIFFRRVRGLVAVSHELANSPAFASYGKPTHVIANGVDLKSFPQLPPASNEIPRLVFIGNPGYTWHGVDKLITLAKFVPDIHLDIVGYSKLPEHEPLPKNVTLHGYLAMKEYQNILATADVAISSLALHRVRLEEASTLKSRECLAFGLPLIIAYVDTDLDNPNCDFLLKIPNKEDNIETHYGVIRDFAYRMRGLRVHHSQIIKIDQTHKEADRLFYFSQLLPPGVN